MNEMAEIMEVSNVSSSQAEDKTSDSDEAVPELEQVGSSTFEGFTLPTFAANTPRSKMSRGEKKARDIVAKLGLKLIPGIVRVTMRKSQNILFVVSNPSVFKNPTSETYIVIGDVKVEDLSQQAQLAAAEKFKTPGASFLSGKLDKQNYKHVQDSDDNDDNAEDDDTVDPKDVELVMSQSGVSKKKAIKELKRNNNDIVNAIMALTM